ncbi:MaoC family dehydratase N-terminal domain-containing protein [Alkalihalobacillus deserti]|uniref:MaoC family dehydratase N-terminal domain-containing protein n=1 Tax=Alkalihalobacillus deserti TaxID=2879466 RepID=UPI001D14AAD6|nr:MaoC family dehydratase N-terminal domain-containing protein [Alkalihalobacillus deserti]
MFQNIVGKRSAKVKNIVEIGWVKKFAEAIGDIDPIYVDEEAASRTTHKKNIAPVTFPVTFDYGTIPDVKVPTKGLIHGEQKYHYTRPLFVGETVYCYAEVKNYYEKKGTFGNMGFLVYSKCVEDEQGELLCKTEYVIIISEAVRKEMSN